MSGMALCLCIYCRNEFDPSKGQGDHIVPAAFGEFVGLKRFRGACRQCNQAIGQSEAQLIRCGPEAVLARGANPPARRRRDRKGRCGAMKAPPPAFVTIDDDGVEWIAKPNDDDFGITTRIDQIVVFDDRGGQYPVLLDSKMTVQAVRKKINSLGIEGRMDKIRIRGSPEFYSWFSRIAKQLWPKSELNGLPGINPGYRPVLVKQTLEINNHYFRALAKIAFHYYLCYNTSGVRGDEPQFNRIRQFIRYGSDCDYEEFLVPPRAVSLLS